MSVCIGGGILNPDTLDILGQITLLCSAALCIAQCLAASLASTHLMPIVTSPQLWQLKLSPGITRYPLVWVKPQTEGTWVPASP